MSTDPLLVMKFGGSSVGTPARFKQIARIVENSLRHSRLLIVVSALSKVTRQLDATFQKAASGLDTSYNVAQIRQRHTGHARAVLSEEGESAFATEMHGEIGRLERALEQTRREGGSPKLRDEVLSVGERLSVPLVALSLQEHGHKAQAAHATELLVTDDAFGAANVMIEQTAERAQQWYDQWPRDVIPVIAGFIGATPKGETTTLGFEGSDYTASLLASMLDAASLIRWTDVDGIYSDDPRLDPEATKLDKITMAEAVRRNEEGRMGMHGKALHPLRGKNISVYVRCIDLPDQPGTVIVTGEE